MCNSSVNFEDIKKEDHKLESSKDIKCFFLIFCKLSLTVNQRRFSSRLLITMLFGIPCMMNIPRLLTYWRKTIFEFFIGGRRYLKSTRSLHYMNCITLIYITGMNVVATSYKIVTLLQVNKKYLFELS